MAPHSAGNQAAAAAAQRSAPEQRRPPSAGQMNAAQAAAARAEAASAPRKPQGQAGASTPRSQGGSALAGHPKFSCGGTVGSSSGGGSSSVGAEADPALVTQLVEMGFDAASARAALLATGQQLEPALDLLASGQVPPPQAQAAAPPVRQQTSGSYSGGGTADAGGAEAALRVVATTPMPPAGGDGLRRAMEAALEQLVLAGGAASLPLLLKLVSNVANAPDEPRFRKVRLTNPKIAASVTDGAAFPAAPRLLAYCGFAPADDGESVALDDAAAHDGARLAEAAVLLQTWAELPQGQLPPPPLGPLDVCVLLNDGGGGGGMGGLADNLPSDFYELSGAEAKALMQASAARKADEMAFKTRETRELDAAKRRRRYRKCLVRVRFPDGTMAQATFSVKAPVSRVLAWVSECLREPGHAFELALPRSPPLGRMDDSLEQAELAPAALLNFRVTDAELYQPPFLAPHLLEHAQTLTDATQAYPQGFGGASSAGLPAVADGGAFGGGAADPAEPRPPPRWMSQ